MHGRFHGILKGANGEQIGEKSTPCLVLDFEVTHQLVRGEWSPLTQVLKKKVKLFLTDATLPFTEKKLERLGFNGDYGNPQFDERRTEDGIDLQATDDGKYENWDLASSKQDMSDKAIDFFNAKWRESHLAPATTPAPVPQAAATDTGVPPDAPVAGQARRAAEGGTGVAPEDDIPF